MIDDNTDIIKLQEILLQRIHDQENKILEKVKSYQERNDKKVMNLENELEVQKTRNISMQNIINTHNLLIDKINILINTLLIMLNIYDLMNYFLLRLLRLYILLS